MLVIMSRKETQHQSGQGVGFSITIPTDKLPVALGMTAFYLFHKKRLVIIAKTRNYSKDS